MKVLSNLDLSRNQLLNFRMQLLGSPPASPSEGLAYWDSTLHGPFFYDGTDWVNAFAVGGAVAFADLTGKPTTIAGYGITDAFSGDYGDLTNTPTLFSGDYDDLTNKPTLFSGVFADLTSKPTTLSGYGITDAVNTSALGANSGVATLDSGGKVTAGQLPSITISDTFVVASQAAMLALTAEVGDVAVRTDLNKSFILKTAGAGILGNWQELLTPTSAVTSVNGQTGAVTLDLFDGAYSSLTGTPDLTVYAPLASPALTGVPTAPTASPGANSTQLATTAYVDAATGTGVVVHKYSTNVGDGTATSYTITHNLNTRDVTVGVREAASPYAFVLPDMAATTVNTVTLTFAVAPTTDQLRVTVTG